MSKKKKKASPKTAQKVLSGRKRLFAKLRYEDKINDELIAKECGINRRRIYEWDKEPEVMAEMERLGRADTQKALRFFQKSSLRAAQATVKLTETRSVKDNKGKVTGQDFVQPGEVVRKASADILQAVEVPIKGPGETGGTPSVLVYLPDNKRHKTSDRESESEKKTE